MNYQQACEKLEKYGQLHLLKYFDELTKEEQEMLLSQIEDIDLTMVDSCKHRNELNQKEKLRLCRQCS